MNPYASETSVPVERSRAEIEEMLHRLGADVETVVALQRLQAVIQFKYKGANFLFKLILPQADDREIKFAPSGKLRRPSDIPGILAQATRARWRALQLWIKALLVAVQSKILNFEEAFLPYLVLGDGQTTAQALLPAVDAALKQGRALPSLGQIGRPLLETDKQ